VTRNGGGWYGTVSEKEKHLPRVCREKWVGQGDRGVIPEKEEIVMRQVMIALVVGGLVSMVGPAGAQDWRPVATLELSQGSVAAGIGFSWGSGTLTYLGRKYPVKVRGLSVGEAGFTLATAKGTVFDLKKLEDFSGTYVAGGGGATVFGGGEAAIMKNQNGVVVELTTSNLGVSFKLAASAVWLTLEQ
jgi:hypothetical protein